MADPLDYLAVGLNIIGMGVQNNAQKEQAKLQQEFAAQRAAISKGQAEFALDQKKKDTRSIKSAQSAAYGASGVTQAGSPQDIAKVTQEQADIEALAILWGGEVGADTAFFEGKIAGQTGKMNQYTTVLNSANSIYNILK